MLFQGVKITLINKSIKVNSKILYESIRIKNTNRIVYIRFNGHYYVAVVRSISNNNNYYVVHMSTNGRKVYCTCKYHLITGKPCKHIVAVINELERKGFLKTKALSINRTSRSLPKPPSS